MKEPTSILVLDNDVLLVIIKHLVLIDPPSVQALVGTSKRFARLAFPETCRSVTLLYPNPEKAVAQLSKKLYEVLLDPRHSVTKHVREIVVAGAYQSEDCQDGDLLEQVLGGLTLQLTSFRWHSLSHMPSGVLKRLETRFPLCKLYLHLPRKRVNDLDWMVDSETVPDMYQTWASKKRTVASPLLSTLTYQIAWSTEYDPRTGKETILSELPILTRVLRASPKLKTLVLGFNHQRHISTSMLTQAHPSQSFGYSAEMNEEVFNPRFSGRFSLPQLKKIVNPRMDYREHGVKSGIDILTWSLFRDLPQFAAKLGYLELHGLSPKLPFKHLEGRVPNLASLDVVLDVELDDPFFALTLIDSLRHLEELSIESRLDQVEGVWDWIPIDENQGTLSKLVLNTTPIISYEGNRFARQPHVLLKIDQIDELLACRNLTHLELDISVEDAQMFMRYPSSQTETPPSRATILSQLTQLHFLALTVELLSSSTFFLDPTLEVESYYLGSTTLTPLHTTNAKASALGLFRQILLNDPSTPLSVLEITFVILAYNTQDREWKTYSRAARVWRETRGIVEAGNAVDKGRKRDPLTRKGPRFGALWMERNVCEWEKMVVGGEELRVCCSGYGWDLVFQY